MRIPKGVALWLQETLLEYDGWQWGLVSFAHGKIGSSPADSEAQWQFGADMIYRALTCDLINVDVYMECHDRESLLSAIRTVSPFIGSGGLLWNGTQVSGTKRLSKVVKEHFRSPDRREGELNPAFIEALEQIFADNGVPWSEEPLLPIMPKVADSQAPASS
jgi:hypothetical protein